VIGVARIVRAVLVDIVREHWRPVAIIVALVVLGFLLAVGWFLACDLLYRFTPIGWGVGVLFMLGLAGGLCGYVVLCITVWSRTAERLRQVQDGAP
jgi:hypothetical protein